MNDVSPAQRLAIGPADVAHSAIMRTELPADLASARQARSAVRQALAAWGMDDLSGDAELLASELVANAVEHGDGQPVSLALRRYADPDGRPAITCEVTGAAPRGWYRVPTQNAGAAWRSSKRSPDPAVCGPARLAGPAGSRSPPPTRTSGTPGQIERVQGRRP